MTNIAALTKANADRWVKAKFTRSSEFIPVAKRLVASKARYKTIEGRTGVPWFVIAVIHERESSQNWSKSIAQGDPWNKVSTHVPKGRGPFKSFEDAAVDALVNCAPYASKWKDWSAGGTCTLLEQYNGLGYANKGLPSPYIWSGTDQYVSGKYVADGVFSPTAVDKQLGCAGLILQMQAFDPSIKFSQPVIRSNTTPDQTPVEIKPAPAVSPAPSKGVMDHAASWLSVAFNAVQKVLKRN